MAAKTGSVLLTSRPQLGEQRMVSAYIDLDAALATTNTYTISNVFPDGGCKVVSMSHSSVRGDTNATPTLTYTIGNSDDADGYKTTWTSAIGLQNSLASQAICAGDGALIGTDITNRDVILTVTANPATGETSGRLRFEFIIQGIN